MDSQEEKCTPISLMVQFRPIWEENLLFAAKIALLSQKSLCSGKYSLFLCDFSFGCLFLITSFLFSPVTLWPATTDSSILKCMARFWVGLVGFFLIHIPVILPGRTMQQLMISVPWCTNSLNSVGWTTELYLVWYLEAHESPCDWYPVSITILDQKHCCWAGWKGETTLKHSHSPSLSAGFAAKSSLKKTERDYRNFLNAVEERATLLLPGLISREAHNSIFLCIHMYAHTHLCPWGEMFRFQRFKNQTQWFLTRL